ncbi:quercetin dioxygenase-like cupin family protein [Sphingomonas vulcanisoli]|uniref:Quercetin dioxygenase-like cupin family protein n=1 Tax=Sphingomonas vulcanisoli TaxID=1658060 RepID=A0ABX0TP94_9SPHN|nr:cupin domain-containing protein [Sphingomonas vulcanisoli]NIJ07322.1 quercetin dioxygenase-like cupin family protein [Sphingomonas vulcanisoli]
MTTELPPVRRIVTGHDASGKAVVIDDGTLQARSTPAGTSHLTLVWTSLGTPIDNDDAIDGKDRPVDLTLPGGSVIRTVDMMPGTTAPMHRTNSLDYGIVISGEIELLLDDEASTLCRPGDIVIQRGTIHSWRNPSADTIARVAFVLLDAKPATVNGAPLPDIHPASVGRR